MIRRPVVGASVVAIGSFMLAISGAGAEVPTTKADATASSLATSRPAAANSPAQLFQTTKRVDAETLQSSPDAEPPRQGEPKEHVLMPALRWAVQSLPAIERLQDYSAVLVKRERINGKLGASQYLALKIRHAPFSVYAKFLAPAGLMGQEVIYIDGQNNGLMWAHRGVLFGTVQLNPESAIAMRDQHYPLTEIGLLNLVHRLVEVAQHDVKYGECEVKYFKNAMVNNRICTCIQVVHPVPRPEFRFHVARVFVDDELSLPIRYESHDWPEHAGGPPRLIEEYTYVNLKTNNGFTDEDFSIRNPQYQFPLRP